MGKITELLLSDSEKEILKTEYKNNIKHCIRIRSKVILLKSEGVSSKSISKYVDLSHISVNNWVKRYKQEGIRGLKTRKGRGRKAYLSVEKEKENILSIIKENRQRIDMAKAEWEQVNDKVISLGTFRNFLKVLAEDINE